MSGARQRVDPRQRIAVRIRTAGAARDDDATKPIIVTHPDRLVGAVASTPHGPLRESHLAALSAARRIADDLGGAVVLILLLDDDTMISEELEHFGVDGLMVVRHAVFASYAPEAQAEVLLALAKAQPFHHLLFPDDMMTGGDCARRMAAQRGERLAIAINGWSAGRITCRQDGGRVEVTRPATRIMTVDASAFPPLAGGGRRDVRQIPPPIWTPPALRQQDCGLQPFDAAVVPISEAALVLSAGNGVTDWSAFHDLARRLGAAEAGSRAVVDAGHLPRNRQVGASGQLIAPECYIALGIAGASQHLQGIAQCRRVVAVNTDLHADMVKRADLAIIADAQAVMAALLHRLRGH